MGIEMKADYDKAKILFWIWKKHGVYIDNPGFRLFADFTFNMLALFSIYAMCVQSWGGPIKCTTTNADKHEDEPFLRLKAVEAYCLIQESYTLHDRNLTLSPDIIAQHGIQQPMGDKEVRYHNYYIWLPYMLFVLALAFRFPYFVWKKLEGSRLSLLLDKKIDGDFTLRTMDLKTPDNAKWRSFMQRFANALIEYRRNGLNRGYAVMFVLCEALNLPVLLVSMWLTDMLLGGEFRTYTVDVLTHILMDDPFVRNDPLNLVFPKAIKCDFYSFGPSGTLRKRDMFCVLGVNLTNEKIFVILWLWLLFLLLVSCAIAAYRTIVIMSPTLRANILRGRVYPRDRKFVDAILERAGYADWFILKRISDNVIEQRFGEICWYMYKQMSADFMIEKDEEVVEVEIERDDFNTVKVSVNGGMNIMPKMDTEPMKKMSTGEEEDHEHESETDPELKVVEVLAPMSYGGYGLCRMGL